MMPADDLTKVNLSIVVPVYRSEKNLPALVERIDSALVGKVANLELILVNDGSPDGSWGVVEELARKYAWIRGICLMRNYGQHNALLCGIRAAKNEIVVTMDDDLQHPPEEVPALIAKLSEGYDVVYGVPMKEAHGLVRNSLSVFTKWALSVATGVKVARNLSAFRAMRRDLRDAFASFHAPNLLLDVLLSWGTTRFATVPVERCARREGTSNYNFLRLLNQAVLLLVGFSTAPLRIANVIGLLATIFGFLIFVYAVGRYLVLGTSVPGFTFLASIISIFAGIQLFVLGMIGEYMARIFHRTNDKPTYAIKQTTP